MNIAKNFNFNVNLGPVASNILQQFAEHKQLSVWQIQSILKNMNYDMAYKNVFIRVKRLLSLHLIEEIKLADKSNTGHGAKYYGLTEEGIFQLILCTPQGALTVDQLSIKTNSPRLVNIHNFMRYHQDNELFKSFLYPHFEEKTVLTNNRNLMGELLVYLHNCCKEIEKWLRIRNIPTYTHSFYWNRVSESNDDNPYNNILISLLKETFELGDKFEHPRIRKIDDKNIIIASLRCTIDIKLDLKRGKAIATLEESDRKEVYQVLNLKGGSDYLISGGKSSSFTLNSFQNNINNALKTLVYKLVISIANDESNEWKHAQEVLSHDIKFYKLRQNSFNELIRGYKKLGWNGRNSHIR